MLALLSAVVTISSCTSAAVNPPNANGCTCVRPMDPLEAFSKAALVFAGEVVSVEMVNLPVVVYTKRSDGRLVPSQSMGRKAVVTLRAIKEWKGDHASEYVVLAGAPLSPPPPGMMWIVDCDLHLDLGRRYLVFAEGHFPEANPCGPTGELDARGAVVAALDKQARKAGTSRQDQ